MACRWAHSVPPQAKNSDWDCYRTWYHPRGPTTFWGTQDLCTVLQGVAPSFLGFRGRAGGPWSWLREEEEDV